MRKEKNGNYYVNGHSCYLLSYHMVLVTKFRNPVLTGKIKETVYDVIKSVMEERDCVICALNGEPDHVHVFFDAPIDADLVDIVRVIKTKSARFSRKRHPEEVSKFYWKPYFWSDSYFIISVGENTRSIVEQYILNSHN